MTDLGEGPRQPPPPPPHLLSFFGDRAPTYLRVWMKIEWLSAEATFHTTAHTAKM